MKKWIRDRVWFGWYWASMCSLHSIGNYQASCRRCRRGQWGRDRSYRTIVGLKPVFDGGRIVRWER